MDETARAGSRTGTPSGGAGGRAPSLTDLAYRSVSEMIRDRRLRGGDVIVEARLAGTLGLSRTPIREALQRLEGEGLVRKGEGRNHVVRRVDLGEYLQSLKLRQLIEPEAAVLAMARIPTGRLIAVDREIAELMHATTYHTDAHWRSDDNLHGMIIDHCGNDVMARTLRELRSTTRLYEIDQLKDRLVPDSTEHRRIVEALRARDEARTRQTVFDHVASLLDFATEPLRRQ
ncbi:hypothetical protein OPKNFCMD_2340 [Methylobacterium crusticola]|uniref:HTH gntR-type domain-containing protein n=1 Tax=Methylobacterium crusticola TaxID=1697972 RepID=A0ABQ4QWI2_9HYPH|nr:GntR family transcriptional regulator [Methylobacterium crusticola]GJD49608.1 hypothetical protein OPKNFCMD_2340 [Methylobacterium crusticola]